MKRTLRLFSKTDAELYSMMDENREWILSSGILHDKIVFLVRDIIRQKNEAKKDETGKSKTA